MKKYLGSKITMFAAVVHIIFIIASIVFTVLVLTSEFSMATIFLSLFFISCALICIINVWKICDQLYTVGTFYSERIDIKPLIHKKYSIKYKDLSSIGIGYYYHGFQNQNLGIKMCFIFFSQEKFDEQYRDRINLWKPSLQQVKVEFDIDLYNYLIQILPQKQALALETDFRKYFSN